jgi:hypothetical protein
VAGTSSRFGRPSDDPEETAERLPDELRAVRERVFRSYVDVREHGVELVEDDEDDTVTA